MTFSDHKNCFRSVRARMVRGHKFRNSWNHTQHIITRPKSSGPQLRNILQTMALRLILTETLLPNLERQSQSVTSKMMAKIFSPRVAARTAAKTSGGAFKSSAPRCAPVHKAHYEPSNKVGITDAWHRRRNPSLYIWNRTGSSGHSSTSEFRNAQNDSSCESLNQCDYSRHFL